MKVTELPSALGKVHTLGYYHIENNKKWYNDTIQVVMWESTGELQGTRPGEEYYVQIPCSEVATVSISDELECNGETYRIITRAMKEAPGIDAYWKCNAKLDRTV